MRLLQRSNTGEFSLTKDLVGDDIIPPYAILSHTWGVDAEEVTFEDLTSGTGKDKLGYEKIRFCGEQARQDDLQYFWIDTCCINKANYTELSQAINSMFRWYRYATRCYVYLSDVSSLTFDTNEELSLQPWELDFRKSRWFKRGWTLQELLAPSSVEFFSREHQRLGDKKSLRQLIHEITGIANLALQGVVLSQFSVDERFSWIERRQTKLEEDKAYSMLGIFDVFIPLIYGEGRKKAFKRLREEIKKDQEYIRPLRITDPRDDKMRIQEQKYRPQQSFDTTGQIAPPGMKPRITATLWGDEKTLCFQVEAKGVVVARREDNHMINGTTLLKVAGLRDSVLKSEKMRHIVKIGPMHLKGVWIPFERALDFANKEKITESLYPLFVHNIGALLYHPTNQTRTNAEMATT
ncbi:hypothetical protein B7463_g8127, partial [Scytalidium lignicola]